MAGLTGISGLRCFCSDLSQALVCCCLCCFSLPWHLASCNANVKGKGKRDSLGNTSLAGLMEDMGKVCACSSPRLGDAVGEQHDQIQYSFSLGVWVGLELVAQLSGSLGPELGMKIPQENEGVPTSSLSQLPSAIKTNQHVLAGLSCRWCVSMFGAGSPWCSGKLTYTLLVPQLFHFFFLEFLWIFELFQSQQLQFGMCAKPSQHSFINSTPNTH